LTGYRDIRHAAKPDGWILGISAITAAFGVLMVYDASAVSAALRQKFDSPTFFLERQVIWFAVGLVCMWIASRVPLERIQRFILPFTLILMGLLALVLIPGIGYSAGGARRWLRWGPLSLQPGELMRLMLALYLAHLFSVKADRIRDFRQGFLPAVTVSGIAVILLAAQPKFGTALILILLTGIMLFAAGTPLYELGLTGVVALPFLAFAVFRVPYIQDRIAAWLNPAAHAQSTGFQMMQSLIAIGSGGIFGSGLGQGRQKMFYLPEAHTDMIFPVIAEELGLMGSVAILFCFAFILFRGLYIAFHTPRRFARILAVGLTMCIVIPAALNLMVATGLFPVTGIALPLISFGGTALVTDMTALGLLAGIPAWAGWNRKGIDEALA